MSETNALSTDDGPVFATNLVQFREPKSEMVQVKGSIKTGRENVLNYVSK